MPDATIWFILVYANVVASTPACTYNLLLNGIPLKQPLDGLKYSSKQLPESQFR